MTSRWADMEEDDEPVQPQKRPQALNWADADDEDANEPTGARTLLMRDAATGIKTYLEYRQTAEGDMIKVIFRVKERQEKQKTNKHIENRKKWQKFGKTFDDTTGAVSNLPIRSDEEVNLEMNKDRKLKVVGEEEKFWENSIAKCDSLFQQANSKAWNVEQMRAQRAQIDELADQAANAAGGVGGMMGGGAPGKYLPPSMRTGGGMNDRGQDHDLTLRVQNLSEDVREGDMQGLFQPFGQIRRVFLAKHREGEKEGLCKGFAFITFKERSSCDKAIEALHGHGYDSLILSVSWAKPREPM